MTAEQQRHLARAEDAVAAAARHHAAAIRALDNSDNDELDRAHGRLGSALRAAQGAFEAYHAAAGANADVPVQVSGGTTPGAGTSSYAPGSGRGSPLLQGNAGIKDWLESARVGAARRR